MSILTTAQKTDYFIRMVPRIQKLEVIDPAAKIVIVDGARQVAFHGPLKGDDTGPKFWFLDGDQAVAQGLAVWIDG